MSRVPSARHAAALSEVHPLAEAPATAGRVAPRRGRPAVRAAMAVVLATLALVPGLLPAPAGATAAAAGATTPIVPSPEPTAVGSWLVLGPFPAPLPALAADDPAHVVGPGELLAQPFLAPARLWPHAGQAVALPGAGSLAWTTATARDGRLDLPAVPGGAASLPRWAAAATYLSAPSFAKARLTVACTQPFSAWLDGKQVATRVRADSTAAEVGADLVLTQGKHALVVFTLADPAARGPWTLAARTTVTAPAELGALTADTSAQRPIRIADYLDTRAVSGVELSAAGDLVAISYRRPEVPADFAERWVEIVRASDGTVVRTLTGEPGGSFTWGTVGHRFSYVTQREDKSTLWVDDLDGGPARAVLKDVEHLGGHRWLPGGQAFLCTFEQEGAKDPAGFKRMRGLTDRWGGSRDVGSLYLVTVADGALRRLTAGRWSCDVQDVAADGRKLLFTRTLRDDATFPFAEDELYELDLATLAVEKVLAVPRGVSALYTPDGRKLTLRAGPSAFGGVGNALPAGVTPNDYDAQLFLLDRASGAIEPLTKSFEPSIGDFAWSRRDGRLYVSATDTTAVDLYAYDPAARKWSPVPARCEAVGGLALSADGTRLAWFGEDAMAPERVYTLDLARRGARSVEVAAPAAAELADVRLGRHETWDFTASSGARILGDVYYPPEYSETMNRSWPCIVFYYGGTSPVSREYGGRYPKNLWAAHGYVVYVLQPSGATGFGQAFSARHVNDWGKTSADEIIEGTRKFLDAHPFVDRAKVGCIGASYGGFMTMLLTTKTDLFAAAIAHAGISSLASYWGEGWWGFDYSSVATAGSYPWNRPDLYVDQSPLFHADRITTPLLLLHGAADTNVPVGESEQLYTALRVLGKPVEFIKVDGQNHWILNYPQRVVWMETIIAWFDRQLKGQPGWWDELYGEGGGH